MANERATSSVPFAVTDPAKIPARRYYDPEFYKLECEKLWPRVWQMACRLEEIPRPGDYVVYEILDQSVIVVRVDKNTVKAYHNHCRHRGVELVRDRGSRPGGFICPFHGWSWSLDGSNTFVFSEHLFEDRLLDKADLHLKECRIDFWGGSAFINFDDNAPPLRDSLEPFASFHDAWNIDTMRTEWWLAARLPVNWKLAMEAFMEGYHVMATHPQLLMGTPGRSTVYAQPGPFSKQGLYITMPSTPPAQFDPKAFIELNIEAMRTLSIGMAGMTHDRDVKIAESLRGIELPNDPLQASLEWRKQLHAAIMKWHREHGSDCPDLDYIEQNNLAYAVNFCFPHYFLLPTYSSASSYRIRPLGPEECLFELWSLTHYPEGEEPPPIKTPTPMAHDDPRWPPIPTQDFSNLPRQQRGLHSKGFEFMRLSKEMEGLISNNHRLIDGYLAGLPYDKLLPATQKVSGPIDVQFAEFSY